MIERLLPSYRFICDRCGKICDGEEGEIKAYPVNFWNGSRSRREGEICSDCYNDFCDLADNFFDEVNKNG